MRNKKIIITNCPCYNKDYSCQSKDNITGKYCQDCTDCVLKQIVEKCKNIKSINKTNSYVGEYIEFTQRSPLADEILELLDIQEVE